jgi:predicted alpha-1,2-mannosidase
MASADFALSQLALALHDQNTAIIFQQRAGWWRNLFNANASSSGGYIQPRNADGSWKTVDFNIDDDDDYVEGSGAQYLWMVPFDAAGLFTAMGGTAHAKARMDRFFYTSGGKLAVTKAGADHPELANEPSIGAPWLYDFTGSPWKAQQVVRAAIKQIWKDSPDGISGNDDLGEMSSWFIWAALGFYPLYPGRAELVLGSPLFEEATISRPDGDVRINARGAGLDSPFISEMWLDGLPANKPWLPSTFVARGGTLNVILSGAPSTSWGAQPADAPPSFGP